jgi:hypothetical protein
VPGREATDSWQLVIDALRAAGAVEVVVSVPEIEAPFERILTAGADGISVPLRALTSRQWEQLAAAVESGKRLWAGALDVGDPSAAPPRVADVVETLWRPWRQLGLPASALAGVRVTPSEGLARHSPSAATAVLARLTKVADGLNQIALG